MHPDGLGPAAAAASHVAAALIAVVASAAVVAAPLPSFVESGKFNAIQ